MKLLEIILKKFGKTKRHYSDGDIYWLSASLYGKELDWQTSKVVAKDLTPYYIGNSFQKDRKKYECKKCYRTLKREINAEYKAKKCKAHLYFTFDGYYVADERFKKFCEDNNYPGLVFIPLPKSPGYYWFYPTIEYKVDWGRGITERSRRCLNCGHTCFSKSNPLFKTPDFNPPSDDFIYRTDIEYGATFCSPSIIIGLKTEAKLLKAGFKGMHYDPVYF